MYVCINFPHTSVYNLFSLSNIAALDILSIFSAIAKRNNFPCHSSIFYVLPFQARPA